MKPLRCPACKSRDVERGVDMHRCRRCGGLFDNTPDEGGDYGNRPDERLIRQERKPRRTDLRGGL